MNLLTTTAPDAVVTCIPAPITRTQAQAALSNAVQNMGPLGVFAVGSGQHFAMGLRAYLHLLSAYGEAYPRVDAPWLPEHIKRGARPEGVE